MKKRNLTKLMSLFLASILAIPTPVFADNTTEITGSVQEAVLDISASLNATYTINPNDESGNYFTANNIEIINNSNMPISIAVKDITSDNTFTDVLPDSVGSKEDWYKLAYNDSNSKIAVGLKYVSGDFIEQNQTDTLYFKSILDATEAIPIGSIAAKNSLTYTLEGYHGLSFSEGKSHVTDITWEFSLYDGSEGGSSGNENTVTIDKEESTVLNYETETTDTASAASILDDLFGVHTVAALEVVKESEINGRPIVGTATITGLKDSSATEIEIADYYEDETGNLYEITGIKEGTESSPTIVGASLETVTISGTNLTEIPAFAFYGNDTLTKVVIEEGIESIGKYAFYTNDNLTEVTLPNSLINIYSSAFGRCENLSKINSSEEGICNFPSNLELLDSGCFFDSKIQEYYIPKSVKTINSSVFASDGSSNDSNRTAYLAADTIDELPNITLTDTNDSSDCFDTYASFFNGKGNFAVKTAELATALVENTSHTLSVVPSEDDFFIKYNTESGNTAEVYKLVANPFNSNPINITIPDTYNGLPVTSIADSAFQNISNGIVRLKSIIVPEGVTSIGSDAFFKATNATVTLPNSLETVGTMGLYGVGSVIYNGNLDTSTWHAISINSTLDGEFIYSDSNKTELIKYVGSDKSVTVPSTVTSIAANTFASQELVVYDANQGLDTTNSPWGADLACTSDSVNGDFVYTDSTKTVLAKYVGSDTEITVPNGTTEIAAGVFSYSNTNTYYTSITLPDTVTTIGETAFYSQYKTDVNMPNSLVSVGKNAFYNVGLSEIVLPEGVTTIGEKAFAKSSLKDINRLVLPSTLETVGSNAFQNLNVLDKFVIIPDGATYTSAAFNKLQTASGYIVTNLGTENYEYMGSTAKITRPDTYDNDYVYKDTTKTVIRAYVGDETENVVIPDTVTEIMYNAFYNRSDIQNITIPSTVTTIGSSAFYKVQSITYSGSATGSPWGALAVNS